MDNPIKIDKKDHVLEVTIDRPKANAIDLMPGLAQIICGNKCPNSAVVSNDKRCQ